MNDKIRSYRDLVIWQRGVDIAKHIYQITAELPEYERFGLSNQLRRSAVSIPSNIAEGQARNNDKEFRYFLRVALGSCAELDTQIILARDLDFISASTAAAISDQIIEIQKMIYGLLKRLNQ